MKWVEMMAGEMAGLLVEWTVVWMVAQKAAQSGTDEAASRVGWMAASSAAE